jgi:hypothetical protein
MGLRSQQIYTSLADPGIEMLLDELATNHVIRLNSVSRPYSRNFIALQLREALSADSLLTPLEKKEIQFYLKNFSPELQHQGLSGSDKISVPAKFRFSPNPVSAFFINRKVAGSVRPLLDFQQIVNVNDAVSQIKPGIAAYIYLGKHIGVMAGIYKQINTQILSNTLYFSPDEGGNWNTYSKGGGDFGEWFGQITCSWKWGMIGIFKDRFQWGENYNGANILSGKPPSFPRLRLYLNPARWIEFEYFHGWLNSDVTDSSRSDFETTGSTRVYIKKYIAANVITFKPWKYLNISIGNSIIYDGEIQLAYFIPVLFYKSVDHTLNHGIENQNSQLFLSIDSRQIRHLNLFLTLFVDEFMISRIRSSTEHNFFSWKAGLKLYDLPVKNLSFTIEGTRTLPGTYQHFLPSITYESDGYNLGHYLRENSQELFTSLDYRPFRGLAFSISYTFTQHGADYPYTKTSDPTVVPVLKDITWQKSQFDASVNYSLTSNLYLYLVYEYRSTRGDVKYTPPVYMGKTHSMIAGIRLGF